VFNELLETLVPEATALQLLPMMEQYVAEMAHDRGRHGSAAGTYFLLDCSEVEFFGKIPAVEPEQHRQPYYVAQGVFVCLRCNQ